MNDANRFNLLTEPWLLVRDLDGATMDLSIVDTFRRADRLAGVAGDVPTQVFALNRLLLAILHRAVSGPDSVAQWRRLWRAEQLPMREIEAYLMPLAERFELFHPHAPFLQVADLRTAKGEVSDLSKLIADVPNGHRFFSSRLGPDLSLSFAEAARWLVHCHAFDPSGIKSGAVGDDRVKNGKGYPIGVGWCGYLGGILPEGASLRETLLLNLIPDGLDELGRAPSDPEHDLPVWERDPLGAAERAPDELEPAGSVTLFTWQSRRIRLSTDGARVTGVLICNGDRLAPQNRHTVETHTGWRRSEAQEKRTRSVAPVYMPDTHRPERVIWRGLESLLPGVSTSQSGEAAARLSAMVMEWLSLLSTERILAPDHAIQVRTVGMTYGSQSSTTAEIIDDALSIRAILTARDAGELKGVVVSCVRAAERAARALGSLAANLAKAAGSREPDGPRTRAIESGYAAVDSEFRAWLAALGPGDDPTDRQAEWHRIARREISALGRELLAAAPAICWVGRRDNGRLYTTAHADAWFRKELREALPMAHETEHEKEEAPA